MEGTYPIMIGKTKSGQAIVERQGLYYCILCQCEIHSEVICRVTLCVNDRQENLGILMPVEGKIYGLCKRLPIKSVGTGIPEFYITPKQSLPSGTFVDVYPDEPFSYISRLENAYLEKRRGRTGLVLPKISNK